MSVSELSWEAFYPFIEKYKSNKWKDIQKEQKKRYKVMAIIGCFKLVEDPIKCWEKDVKKIKVQFKDNAHFLRNKYDPDTIIINGNCSESKKLPKAVLLAWNYDPKVRGYVGADYLSKFGLDKKRFQQSSDIHFLEGQKAEEFITFVNTASDKNLLKNIFS